MKAVLASLLLSSLAGQSLALPTLSARRFGQQNPAVQGEISGLNFAQPGLSGTLSGTVPSTLLGAADPCAKLRLADQIVAAPRSNPADQAPLFAAMKLVNAEQNFNPANGAGRPVFCNDGNLPATKQLRGILPHISDVDGLVGAAAYNTIADATLATALKGGKNKSCRGQSIAEQVKLAGFTDFKDSGVAPPAQTQTQDQTPPPAQTQAPPAKTQTQDQTPPATQTQVATPPQGDKDLGSCSASAAALIVGVGVDSSGERAQEVRFVPAGFQKDAIFGGQGSALNGAIVANFPAPPPSPPAEPPNRSSRPPRAPARKAGKSPTSALSS
ncbi:uncharacterized protein EV422DRAFT_115397 [Fimicolochytrium jonesii]|uniref:uncharacterized protein n=1 Tax=Fimicolochytrium jonesii TaxID=1396493 RepID=UPI0022FE52F5|nr:uncharacterized protein EV422DRAFT_115397 [Fimicolochytrium jonesii]KAI8819500.1 hypothetical protein EV422DRAFT_115397 [Fimicolochytrium jonesii]